MNAPETIEKLYNMYSDEETTPRIVKVASQESVLGMDLEDGPADPYLEL